MRLPPIRITSSSVSRISTERGTTALTPNRINTSGISSAARPIASTMRLRSGRLAKRQMPQYRPKRQNATACSGTTQTSVVSAAENSSGGIARLKRSQYAPTQAKNAARMSCRMMPTVRELRFIWNTVPAPIDGQKDQEIYSGRQYKQPCGVLDITQQREGQPSSGTSNGHTCCIAPAMPNDAARNPSGIDPASPMNTRAGGKLKRRNARADAAIAAQNAASPGASPSIAASASAPKPIAAMPPANPSVPSMKLYRVVIQTTARVAPTRA